MISQRFESIKKLLFIKNIAENGWCILHTPSAESAPVLNDALRVVTGSLRPTQMSDLLIFGVSSQLGFAAQEQHSFSNCGIVDLDHILYGHLDRLAFRKSLAKD